KNEIQCSASKTPSCTDGTTNRPCSTNAIKCDQANGSQVNYGPYFSRRLYRNDWIVDASSHSPNPDPRFSFLEVSGYGHIGECRTHNPPHDAVVADLIVRKKCK